MKKIWTAISGALLATGFFESVVSGQGTFQNLNFEAAMIVPTNFNAQTYAAFGPAFPGWTGYLDGSPATLALYNNRPLDASAFGLVSLGSPLQGTPIEGQYTAYLQGGTFSLAPNLSLGQSGVVPTETMSLRFLGWSSRDNFIVSMNGQPLSVITLQDFGNFRREYGVDVAGFAGQTAELRFTQPAGPGQYDILVLDQISFSPLAVPEPSTWALLALGTALFWYAAWRRRKYTRVPFIPDQPGTQTLP